MSNPSGSSFSFDTTVPTREDSYNFYSLALVIVIFLTIFIGVVLRLSGCVPPNYFPFSIEGWVAIGIIGAVCVTCLLARGMTLPIILSRKKSIKPKINLNFLPQWLLELIILLPSVLSLHLLLQTSGGATGPFNSYLGTFPLVITVLTSSRRFVIMTFLLTLSVYILSFGAPQVTPAKGHEVHYAIASVATFAASLAFTALIIMSELAEATTEKLSRGAGMPDSNPPGQSASS